MLKWIKMAFRNILKNKRRSLTTLLAIAVGFTAISLFRGYADRTYWGLRMMAICGEGLGHLTVFKKGWHENGKIKPNAYMFSQNETQRVIDQVEDNDNVLLATPQLSISGLVSNGRTSTIFLANGVVPSDEKTIRGSWTAFSPVNGQALNDNKPYNVEMAEGLANLLELRPGSDAVVMAPTLDGQMNALDIVVSGVYDTGTEATNDKFIRVPFDFAQSLYNTEKADRIVVLLDDWEKTESVRKELLTQLTKAGLPSEIMTWDELSLFYSRVKGMFDMIFMFLFIIVLTIVVMSVVNTMGMAVIERTREIGTLRALGLKRRGIGFLFAIEGGMIGFLGCIAGIFFNIFVWAAILYIRPMYIPPGNSSPVPLEIGLVPEAMAVFAVFLIILSLLAAILPAQRAARQNMVEALGHV
ncbi:MAG: ABC transporter permease [Deltaproteobacteria bacterium]|nr:ABC transporter permease [Deltaproteobacteria bacterium]